MIFTIIDDYQIITRSFEERIAETGAAQKLAEENVEKTNMEIDNLDHNIKSIKRAISEKGNPLKVSPGSV